MSEVIELMRELFSEVGKKQVVMPEREVIDVGKDSSAILFMPGYVPKRRGLGIKIVSVFQDNATRGIPTVTAQILLNDPDTGEVMAILEGAYITALRTGAVSAVATDLLATMHADRVGIFGSGVQARSQIEAILEVRKIRSVKIHSVNLKHSENLAQELKKSRGQGCNFQAVGTSEDVIRDSDIIVTATTSKVPVFDGNILREGIHINSIGSFKPDVREVDDPTVMRSRIFVDSRAPALKEAGDLIIPIKKGAISEGDIQADLGELVLGEKKGRQDDSEITFFKSVGMAVEDIVVARRIYERAVETNAGVVLA